MLPDPGRDPGDRSGSGQRIRGVRLETRDGPIVAFGTLDPKSPDKPATFADAMTKPPGREWGEPDRETRPYLCVTLAGPGLAV